MLPKQRSRTTSRHFERANTGETGERKKREKKGEGEGKRGGREGPPARELASEAATSNQRSVGDLSANCQKSVVTWAIKREFKTNSRGT